MRNVSPIQALIPKGVTEIFVVLQIFSNSHTVIDPLDAHLTTMFAPIPTGDFDPSLLGILRHLEFDIHGPSGDMRKIGGPVWDFVDSGWEIEEVDETFDDQVRPCQDVERYCRRRYEARKFLMARKPFLALSFDSQRGEYQWKTTHHYTRLQAPQ